MDNQHIGVRCVNRSKRYERVAIPAASGVCLSAIKQTIHSNGFANDMCVRAARTLLRNHTHPLTYIDASHPLNEPLNSYL